MLDLTVLAHPNASFTRSKSTGFWRVLELKFARYSVPLSITRRKYRSPCLPNEHASAQSILRSVPAGEWCVPQLSGPVTGSGRRVCEKALRFAMSCAKIAQRTRGHRVRGFRLSPDFEPCWVIRSRGDLVDLCQGFCQHSLWILWIYDSRYFQIAPWLTGLLTMVCLSAQIGLTP